MWAFLTGRQIDWAHLVRYRMHKALRANAPLPYPHLITLFLHHFQIPLDDEPFVQVKRSFAIGAGAVTSFGCRKDRDGQWLKKDAQPPQDERTPSPPPQRDDSLALMNEVLSELRGLRTYVGERFDSLDGRIDAIDARFEGMNTRITQLEEDVSYLRRCFDLPPPS